MNERIIKERRRDAWLIVTGALLVVLLVAGLLLLRLQPTLVAVPKSGLTPLPHETAPVRLLPAPTRSELLSTPTILGQTPEPDGVSMTGVAVGQNAPDFTLPTMNGDTLTLSDLRGQAVLLNFWASWCGPCRLEMPALVQAYEKHQIDGLEIVAFNATFQDSLPAVKAFVDEFQLPFPVVLDEAGHIITDDYQLRGLPMSIFINRDGTIARVQLGAMSEAQIEGFIEEILAK